MNKDKSFWKSLNPNLHICDDDFLQQTIIDFDQSVLNFVTNQSLNEGYFQLDPVEWSLPISEMATAITNLKTNNIQTVFAFVYDEYWIMFYKLHKLISSILGDYKRIPGFWAWHVDPTKEESGWNIPHRDKGKESLFPDGRPKSYSFWLPLSDATPLNGCLYVVPSNRDPFYNKLHEGKLEFNYADIRALPAQAGSVIGWTDCTLHWGSKSSKLSNSPRISIAMEFQRVDVHPFSSPLSDYNYFFNYEERLKLIWQQISQYQYWYHLEQ